MHPRPAEHRTQAGRELVQFLLKRLGFYLLAGWAAMTLNFFLPRLMPGDPASAIFGRFQGRLAPEALDALKDTFGLTDAPLLKQYVTYVGSMLRGDLGISVAYFPAPVTDVIAGGFVWTIFLAGTAVLLSFAHWDRTRRGLRMVARALGRPRSAVVARFHRGVSVFLAGDGCALPARFCCGLVSRSGTPTAMTLRRRFQPYSLAMSFVTPCCPSAPS